jgi:RNA polymerase sigma-70 factor (ECF subfamily)
MDKAVAESALPFASAPTRAQAFERLADRHLTESYRLAMVILGDPADAHDVVHDAFVTAWHRWDSLRDHAKFERWFQRIVVNVP